MSAKYVEKHHMDMNIRTLSNRAQFYTVQQLLEIGYNWTEATAIRDIYLIFGDHKTVSGQVGK